MAARAVLSQPTAKKAALSQAQIATTVLNNNITAQLRSRKQYSDTWPWTFARASGAYRNDGVLVGSGVPRFEMERTVVSPAWSNLLSAVGAVSLNGIEYVLTTAGSVYTASCGSGTLYVKSTDAGGTIMADHGSATPGNPLTVTAVGSKFKLTGVPTTLNQLETGATAHQWIPGGTSRAEVANIASKGIRVEEGTTNLLPAGNENFLSPWAGISDETVTVTDYPINIPGVGDVIAKRIKGTGNGTSIVKYQRQLSGLINPHTHTISVWAMLLSGNAAISNSGTDVAITSTMQRLTATRTIGATTTNFQFRVAATTDVLDVVAYAPQIEDKAYATSYFTPGGGARADESLSVPATVIDPALPFSIELDVTPLNDAKVVKNIFGVGDATNYIRVTTQATNGYYTLLHVYNGGISRSLASAVAVTTGVKVSLKVSVSGSTAIFSLNGADVGTMPFDGLPSLAAWRLYLGAGFDRLGHRNAVLSNVRIRLGAALSAAERAYTGALSPDQYTTFYAPFKVVA